MSAIVILGFGLGATLYMFTVVKAYMLSPLPYPESERIMDVSLADPRRDGAGTGLSETDYLAWRESQKSFAAVATYYTNSVVIADGDYAERVSGAFVTPSAFDVVQTEPHIGRTLAPSDGEPGAPWVIVLGYDIWQNRYGGDPAVLGKTLRATGVPATVVGVMPPGFRFPAAEQVWLPLKLELENFGGGRGRYLDALGRLRSGVTLEQARAEFANLHASSAAARGERGGLTTVIRPYQDAYVSADTRTVIRVMFAAVLFVLLIACANVANLILARTIARRRDIALRAALGAGRGRIVAHILTESVLLASGGAVIGYFLADLALDLTRRAYAAADIQEPFWVVLQIDRTALAVAALAAAGAGLIAGVAPALRAMRTDVNEYLKEGAKGGGSSLRLNRTMVTAEIGLSCILLVCAGLMMRTAANFEARPLGVETGHLLTGSIDLPFTQYPEEADWYRFYSELVTRLEDNADVEAATVASSYPGMNSWIATYRTQGMDVSGGASLPLAQYAGVMDNYARMLGLTLIRGRWFDAGDAADSEPVAIVDARFAAQVFPDGDAIGKRIAVAPGRADEPPSQWRRIVGITEATFMGRVDGVERPAIFVPLRQNPYVFLKVAVRTRGEPLAFADTLQETVRGLDPSLAVFWVRTYENWLWANNFDSRSVSAVFTVFALISLVLAAAGLYGVLAYSVSQRTREIGVRRTLGAGDRRILCTVLGQGMLQAAIGIGAGILVAAAFAGLLRAWLYGVTPLDIPTLAAVALLLAVVALAASLIPALRAMRVTPMEALRNE